MLVSGFRFGPNRPVALAARLMWPMTWAGALAWKYCAGPTDWKSLEAELTGLRVLQQA